MRKRVSKRRWKARYAQGKYVPMEAVVNHRLERLVANATWNLYSAAVKRSPNG